MASIGTRKGTVDLNDWERAEAILLIGDNAATNAPRMLTWLAEADRRGAQLVHINPLLEAASRRTIVPHELVDMATFHTTKIGTMNVQVRIGGDTALLRGVAKAVFEAATTDRAVLDQQFIEAYTHGCGEYRALCEATPWSGLVRDSGVHEPAIRKLADVYMKSGRVIIAWCLGITQLSTSTASTRFGRSSTCFCCEATSAGRVLGPARFVGIATCRGTARVGSPTGRRRPSSIGSRKSARLIHLSSTGWGRSRRSRRCIEAT
jgi:anaerobic selenocysteine-containing dehydrogenase